MITKPLSRTLSIARLLTVIVAISSAVVVALPSQSATDASQPTPAVDVATVPTTQPAIAGTTRSTTAQVVITDARAPVTTVTEAPTTTTTVATTAVPETTVATTTAAPTTTVATTAVPETTVAATTTAPTTAASLTSEEPAVTAAAARSPYQVRVDDLTAEFGHMFDAYLPAWALDFEPDNGQAVAGYTVPAEKRVVVRIDPGDSPARTRHILAHEIGHAVDLERLTDSDRIAWMDVRGQHTHQWWPNGNLVQDVATPAGDFAEAVATYLIGSKSRTTIGTQPGQPEFDFIARALR